MKTPFKILTTAAAAGALIAGGLATAAPANAANPNVTVQGVITPSTTAVAVPVFTASTPITVNTNTGGHGSLELWFNVNGAVMDGGGVFQDDAGNATVDLIKELGYAAFDSATYGYGDVPAGTYTAYFTQAATSDFGYPTETDYLASQSPNITIAVAKGATKITGWKTKSKSAKHGHLVKTSNPKVSYAGTGKLIFQYKKKGSKKWATSESATIPSSLAVSGTFKTHAFNTIKHKLAKRGTYYFRFTIPATAYVTGATTKQIKISWK